MTTLRSLLLVGLTSLALGCNVGSTVQNNSPDASPVDDTDGAPTSNAQISGDITGNQVWMDAIEMTGDTTIKPGVRVTVAAGTAFTAAQNAMLRVEGELVFEGSEAEPITMNPVAGAGGWGGILAEAGGKVTLLNVTGSKVATLVNCSTGAISCHLEGVNFTDLGKVLDTKAPSVLSKSNVSDMANAGVAVGEGADLTIVDSTIWTSTHDIIVQNGGNLLIEYSEVGGANMSYEHCDLHIGRAGTFTLRYSNIVSAIYGIMIGNTTNAVLQYNNFMGNDPGQDISPVGPNTNADMRFNYWDKGAPTDLGADYNVGDVSATPIAEAGPRIQQ